MKKRLLLSTLLVGLVGNHGLHAVANNNINNNDLVIHQTSTPLSGPLNGAFVTVEAQTTFLPATDDRAFSLGVGGGLYVGYAIHGWQLAVGAEYQTESYHQIFDLTINSIQLTAPELLKSGSALTQHLTVTAGRAIPATYTIFGGFYGLPFTLPANFVLPSVSNRAVDGYGASSGQHFAAGTGVVSYSITSRNADGQDITTSLNPGDTLASGTGLLAFRATLNGAAELLNAVDITYNAGTVVNSAVVFAPNTILAQDYVLRNSAAVSYVLKNTIDKNETFIPLVLSVGYNLVFGGDNHFALTPGLALGAVSHVVDNRLNVISTTSGIVISRSDQATQYRFLAMPSLGLHFQLSDNFDLGFTGKLYLIPNGYSDIYNPDLAAQLPALGVKDAFLWYGSLGLSGKYTF